MPARCGHCGGIVMAYRHYMFHFRPSATCGGCGRRVRLHGFHALVLVGIVGVAGAIAGVLLIDSPALLFAFAGTLAVVFLALDWWSWKALSWDPVDGEQPASKAPPNPR